MALTIDEKIEIVHLSRGLSYQKTAEKFNRLHPGRPPIYKQTIGRIFRNLRMHGNLQPKRTRTLSNQRAIEKASLIEEVVELFENDPHMSTRRAGFRLGTSHISVWKILRELKFKPYKMSKHQKLHPDDPPKRKAFCEQLLQIIEANPGFRNTILWTDEKPFAMNGCFNRQNFRWVLHDIILIEWIWVSTGQQRIFDNKSIRKPVPNFICNFTPLLPSVCTKTTKFQGGFTNVMEIRPAWSQTESLSVHWSHLWMLSIRIVPAAVKLPWNSVAILYLHYIWTWLAWIFWNWLLPFCPKFPFSFWAQNNPHWVGEVNQVAPAKVMAWAGILGTTIIGPFFFDGNVNGDSYLEMITDYILPQIHRKGFDSMQICYMHDGAPAHITRDVRTCLDDNFQSWIGRCDGERKLLAWPPRSPDLNMLDFFLWGVLHHRVHMVEYDSVDELGDSVFRETRRIPPAMLHRVQEHLMKRLRKCIEENGQLFEHKLKWKQTLSSHSHHKFENDFVRFE